ncbi:PLP-dependent aminotransferase family protein [Arthrobacter crystallopoietes]|uniref:aminotransferase-like domain-containing protein n=1 Tax=Crystallibacter crystallopoietes TaxID=37928 RepID=UPI0011113893|nr:PLP-dependent aminotransferase family protein [Arthrobacter crystallopoietes]
MTIASFPSSRAADLFAARASGYKPSPVREVFDISMQPGMISLAGGNPDLSVLHLDALADTAAELVRTQGLDALQYGGGGGTRELQELICSVMAAEGNPALPANVQVTAGSQMALELLVKLFCDPGDVILAEGPTYVGAISVFDGLQADVVHVPMDDDGLIPGELERKIDELAAEGKRVKLLYTIPNFHNPSGVTLSAGRRADVVRICRAAGLAIIEDNPYGMLSFDGLYLPSLHQLDPENVFYLGSFSKIFSPGVRVGWAVVPDGVRRQLQLASEATTICPSVLSQMLVQEYLRQTDWRQTLATAADLYRDRCEATMTALADFTPAGTTWTEPTGGFFTWVTLPEGISGEDVMHRAIGHKVVFVPGSAFYSDGAGGNQLRIAFSFETPERLREGVRRLGLAIAESIQGATA